MLNLFFCGDICELKNGICELAHDYGYVPSFDGGEGIDVNVVMNDEEKLSVKYSSGKAEIVCGKRYHFFRALGLLIEKLRCGEEEFIINENCYFTMNGPMFDVSQGNAVINVSAAKSIIRKIAVMGMNMIMMYCEDSYDLPGHPYFGYMRSRYTEDDMRTLDAYADMFGIEMIPCIQTLAHLQEVLKWDVYKDFSEDDACLLVGDERTYDFIRDMLVTASRPFKTKRINIGMDEAGGLGRGKYQDLHGVRNKTEIMLEHLNRVMEIVRELGLQPMMWSDMFFRAESKNGKYRDMDVRFSQKTIDSVPKDVQLVFWDYYDTDESVYDYFIDRHFELGNTVFAGGVWTWSTFAPNHTKTFRTTEAALKVCKKRGIKEIIATVWGDAGTECSVYATMLGFAFFAEHAYSDEVSMETLKRRFEFCTGASFDDFMKLHYLNEAPGVPEGNMNCASPTTVLLWQDVLGALYDKNIEGLPLNEHYRKLAEELKIACERNGEYNLFFKMNYALAYAMAEKAEMGLRLTAAYKAGDKAELRKFADEYLPELKARISALRKAHFTHWYEIYKSFGWDGMDLRYGKSLARIDTAIDIINMYLDGTLPTIEELDEPRLLFNGSEGIGNSIYRNVSTASRIW